MTHTFPILITQDTDGMFFARLPLLPGCHTQARTLPTLLKRIKQAAALCAEVQKAKRQTIPTQRFIGVQQIEISL